MASVELQADAFKTWYPSCIVVFNRNDKRLSEALRHPLCKETYEQKIGCFVSVKTVNTLPGIVCINSQFVPGVYVKSEAQTKAGPKKAIRTERAKKVELVDLKITRKLGNTVTEATEKDPAVQYYRSLFGSKGKRVQANTVVQPDLEKLDGRTYLNAEIAAVFKRVWKGEVKAGSSVVLSYHVTGRMIKLYEMFAKYWEQILKGKKEVEPSHGPQLLIEKVEVKVKVTFAQVKPITKWPTYEKYDNRVLGTIQSDLKAVLGLKDPDEAAFNGLRIPVYGRRNAGKSCLIYSMQRSCFGKLGYRYVENRIAPPKMKIRKDASVLVAGEGTHLGNSHATSMLFYPVLSVRYGRNQLKGSLTFCDTEGFEQGAKKADLRKAKAKTLGRGEGALMVAALAKRGQEEVDPRAFAMAKRVHRQYFGQRIIPDIQVFVISSVEYLDEAVGEDLFTSACEELEMFYNISRNEGLILDDFVVVLTKLDLFVAKLRGVTHVADDGDYDSIQEVQQMKELVAGLIPKYDRGGRHLRAQDYIFTVASHTIPTDREITRSIAPKTFEEEQVRWIRKNDNALDVLSRIVTQVRHRRQDIGRVNEHTFLNTKMHQFCRWLASDRTKHDVFLSYEQTNLRQALGCDEAIGVIRNGLRHYGLGVYCDLDKKETHNIGDIFKHVKDSRAFVAVLTKDYFKSPFCLAELICASHEKKQIFYIIGLNETGSRQVRHSLGAFKPDKVLSDLFETKGDLNGWYQIVKEFYKKNDVERFVLTSLKVALKNAEDEFGLPLEVPQKLDMQMKAQQRFMDWFKIRWEKQMKEKLDDVLN